eukprot:scaffold23.g4144.t1
MNGNSKQPRSRPTNNQLLYKAHFRWKHYTSPLAAGTDLPEGTEACASVTSAFLQVLATIHRAESSRLDKARNILAILSTNTRRTKVVELSTGTHRVADDLRRHSLTDGEGGHYSTNLDRNRYGSDNNYLFTVTKFNLECLGLCPCLVDIEIVDTRNGNEVQLVTAGDGACSCDSPARKERADASHFTASNQAAVAHHMMNQPGGPSPAREGGMKRAASAGQLQGGGMRRTGSAAALRRPPSAGNLQTHSRNSGGSELFDALLAAATENGDAKGGEHRSRGEPPVTSRHYTSAQLARQRSRMWQPSHNEVDSLQDAIDAFKGDEEVGTAGLARLGSKARRMARRNSVSMIVENPVLAQTGAADSLIMQMFPPFHALPYHVGGADEAQLSDKSHEGDTEGQGDAHAEVDDHHSFRQGLLRQFHKQSSAANLTRLTHPAEARRLQEEARALREECKALEGEAEEARVREKEAGDKLARCEEELTAQRDASRRAADTIVRLKQQLAAAQAAAAGARTAAQQQAPQEGQRAGGGATAAAAAAEGVAETSVGPAAAGEGEGAGGDPDLEGLATTEQEIERLRRELAETKAALAHADGERREAEHRVRLAAGRHHPFAGLPYAHPLVHSLYGMGPPPLNPYGGMSAAAFRPPLSAAMQKVASMPLLAHAGLMSPPELAAAAAAAPGGGGLHKRRAESPIPEGADEGEEALRPAKRTRDGSEERSGGGPAGSEGQGGGAAAGLSPVSPETGGGAAPAGDTPEVGGGGANGAASSPPAASAPPRQQQRPAPANTRRRASLGAAARAAAEAEQAATGATRSSGPSGDSGMQHVEQMITAAAKDAMESNCQRNGMLVEHGGMAASDGGEEDAGAGGALLPVDDGAHVAVAVAAGDAAAAAQQEEAGEVEATPIKLSFLRRMANRVRSSLFGSASIAYRDSTFLPLGEPVERDDARCGCLSPDLLPRPIQEVVCAALGSLPWHGFILALSAFTLFAGPAARYYSAPDAAEAWINGFLVGGMAIFVGEVGLSILCSPETNWFSVVLELLATAAILWDITWFADALGLQASGATTAAAQARAALRSSQTPCARPPGSAPTWQLRAGWALARSLPTRASALGRAVSAHPARHARAGHQDAAVCAGYTLWWRGGEKRRRSDDEDAMEPINVGTRLREAATLQVAVVVVTTVVATALLLVRDTEKLSYGLEAFAAALAALAAGGAAPPQLQAVVDDMLAFGDSSGLSRQLVPKALRVGDDSWSWVGEHGEFTARSRDRLEIVAGDGLVRLHVDASQRNQEAAMFEMIIMAVVLVLLICFVASMYLSIHKARRGGIHGAARVWKDDDMCTIEAAVVKMSRIVTHHTSAGGVGLNSVKRFAEASRGWALGGGRLAGGSWSERLDADHSTKQWLATMVAGPAQEEVATAVKAERPAPRGMRGNRYGSVPTLSNSRAGSKGGSKTGSVRSSHQHASAGLRRSAPHGPGSGLHRSSLGPAAIAHALSGMSAQSSGNLSPADSVRRSVLSLYLQKGSPSKPQVPHSYQRSRLSGLGPSLLPPGLSPSELLALAADAAAPPAPPPPPPPAAPAAAPAAGHSQGGSLSSAQRLSLLSTVDVDVLVSFGFDALALSKQQLVAFVVSMFVELELAYFTGADLELLGQEQEQPGFIDVPTLWAFVEEARVGSLLLPMGQPALERGYQDVPYHNFWHCVDVTHTTFAMIQRISRKARGGRGRVQMTGLEKFALMIAALSHDLDHPGLNNAFLVNNKDPVAITYNDSSVLENKHVACLYALLERKPEINVLRLLDPGEWREARKIIIASVLHTDMVHHFPMVSKIDVFYEMHAAEVATVHRALRKGMPIEELPPLFGSAEERQLLHVLLIHCADISNPVKPTSIADKWTDRVLQEFFEQARLPPRGLWHAWAIAAGSAGQRSGLPLRALAPAPRPRPRPGPARAPQGDRERAAGQPVSPMCDRATTSRAMSQINFIEFVVAPIFVSHKAEQRLAAFHDKYREQFARRRRRVSSLLSNHSAAGLAAAGLAAVTTAAPGWAAYSTCSGSSAASTPLRGSGDPASLAATATAAASPPRGSTPGDPRGSNPGGSSAAGSLPSSARLSQPGSGREPRRERRPSRLSFTTGSRNRVVPDEGLNTL